MSDTFRAICAELVSNLQLIVSYLESDECGTSDSEELIGRARTLLAQPEPPELTDKELLELMPQQFRDDLATVSRTAAHGAGPDITPGIFRVSLNTGALDYARAAIAADRALCARPTPQPPADGEVGELVRRLKELAHAVTKENWREFDMRVPADPLRDADLVLTRAADLLQRQHPQPVAVSERPWERKGWRDDEGKCWMGDPGGGEFIPSWRLCRPEDAPIMTVSLPSNALPTPEAHDN